MGFSYFKLAIISLFINKAPAITNKVSNYPKDFVRHSAPNPPTNWEPGLREAANQALIREKITNPELHDNLLNAPIIGHKNQASPFGDIAILAKGKLINTPNGLHFVQENNDCIECNLCDENCKNNKNIMALWMVKRVRHRDEHNGHRYELEYVISPTKSAKRNPRFDNNYGIPGHVFVVKTNPSGAGQDFYKIYSQDKNNYVTNVRKAPQWYTTHDLNLEHQYPPIHYEQQPPPPLENFEDIKPVTEAMEPIHDYYQNQPNYQYLPVQPQYHNYIPPTEQTLPDSQENHQTEIDLYKNLVHTLAQKTSTYKLQPTKETRFKYTPNKTTHPTNYEVSTGPKHTTTNYVPVNTKETDFHQLDYITNPTKFSNDKHNIKTTVFVPDYHKTTHQTKTSVFIPSDPDNSNEDERGPEDAQTTQDYNQQLYNHHTTQQITRYPNREENHQHTTQQITRYPNREENHQHTTQQITRYPNREENNQHTTQQITRYPNRGENQQHSTQPITRYPNREENQHHATQPITRYPNTPKEDNRHITQQITRFPNNTPAGNPNIIHYTPTMSDITQFPQQTEYTQYPSTKQHYQTTHGSTASSLSSTQSYSTQFNDQGNTYSITSNEPTISTSSHSHGPNSETTYTHLPPSKTPTYISTTLEDNQKTTTGGSETSKPIPTFYIDYDHPGYPKTTPTTSFTDRYNQHHVTNNVQYTQNLNHDKITPTHNYQTPNFVQVPLKTHKPKKPIKQNAEDNLEELFPHKKYPNSINEQLPPTKQSESNEPTKTTDDFLFRDNGHTTRKNKNKKVEDSDIFGKDATTKKTTPKDEFELITPIVVKTKTRKRNDTLETLETKNPNAETTTHESKIIYSDFYIASTANPTTNLDGFTENTGTTPAVTERITTTPRIVKKNSTIKRKYLNSRNKLGDDDANTPTNNKIVSTTQSYSTSITFEVNKKNGDDLLESKTTGRSLENTGFDKGKYNDIALSLINNAKSIDYLENQTRRPKYRRKIYTKTRKLRKKIIDE